MATTKELLEKAMLRLGSRGARGSGSFVSISIDTSSQNLQEFVASADGFIVANGLGDGTHRDIKITSSSGIVTATTSSSGGYGCVTTLPVAKGETYSVRFRSMIERTMRFYTSIGGGLRSLAETLGRLRVSLFPTSGFALGGI